MEQSKKISRKVISVLLSLLMVFSCFSGVSLTAFAAPTETLLTKITPTGIDTYSETVPGVVTVTLSNISRYKDAWAYGGTVTVEPKEGYTITKCIFNARAGVVEDTEAPFSIDVREATYVYSVEVYGYQAASDSYVDGNGESQPVNATALEATTTNWTDGSWYIVPEGGLTISGRITVNGTVNLILRDGATLTANAGITTTGATLNIYAQSAGTGALTAKGSTGCAGIGGRVGGYGSNGGAGGTVSIFGGTVTATGGTANSGDGAGAGIGGGGKDMRGSAGASGTLTLGKGVKLYSGTNNSGDVLDGIDSTERSYNGSRPQNMYAEFISAGSVDKTALNNAITAAETLYNSIKDDTNYSTIASTLKTAIDAAKEVADSETADQDAVDTANGAISDATATAVVGMINALPASTEVTTSDKDKIEAVRAAYDNLTDDQKKKVDTETLKKLTDAETALQDAVDTETAQGATNTINALPDADKVTTADKEKIEAARKAYNDLTDDQKKKVSDDTLKKLTDAEDALKAAEQKDADDTAAAQSATDTINNLPDADKVTTSDKEAIEAARAAYEALTDDQKAKVAPETLQKLVDDEAALKEAEDTAAAQAVTDEINALPSDKVATTDKEAIEKARAAYDALSDDQKAKVPAEAVKALEDAEKALTEAEKAAAEEAAAKELAAAKKNAKTVMYNGIGITQKGKKITVKWRKVAKADGYFVYVQYCGKKYKKPVKTIKKNSTTKVTITKLNGKKINRKKNYKVYVAAYKNVKGKKVVLAKSISARVAGDKNKKYTNVKTIKATKKALTVKVGKTAKAKAKVTLVNKNKKHLPTKTAPKFRYKTSNKSVATVDKKGNIKGIKKGTCNIYIYSINGKMTKIKVTVK
ncbi:MAG: Ig-like domain-containing protein [Eubacterium sp.]|nr:Ig-like domain-containing protein [Eubacterium sp.]